MQNKPNFLHAQMNASHVKTRNYRQKTMNYEPTKQTHSKPIELAFIGERRPAEALAKAGLSQPSIFPTSAGGQATAGGGHATQEYRTPSHKASDFVPIDVIETTPRRARSAEEINTARREKKPCHSVKRPCFLIKIDKEVFCFITQVPGYENYSPEPHRLGVALEP